MDAPEWVPLEWGHMHFLFMFIWDWNVGDIEVALLESISIDELVALAIFAFIFRIVLLFDDLEGG